MTLQEKIKTIPHAEGVVWGLFGDDSASLIQRGSEERRIAERGGDLLLKRADVMALAASHDALMGQMVEALSQAHYALNKLANADDSDVSPHVWKEAGAFAASVSIDAALRAHKEQADGA